MDIPKIRSLTPTLVICNKEENVKEQIAEISEFAELLVTDIKDPEGNLELIRNLGKITDRRITALRLEKELEDVLRNLQKYKEISAAYLIWKEPFMTIGNDTYIHALMKKCGLRNIFLDRSRYPQTTLNEIANLNPRVVLLSSEPYPFKEKHKLIFQDLLPSSQVHLVDGEVFSWYGTRLIKKVSYLNQLMKIINS